MSDDLKSQSVISKPPFRRTKPMGIFLRLTIQVLACIIRDRVVEMKIKYPLKIHKAEEGGYWAEFPDLPGCVTEGDTEEELLEMAKDALSGWLAVRFERNFAIPEAKPLKGRNVRWVEPSPDVSIPLMIRKIRNELGLSQKEVADRLRITYQTYQAWENPKVANPTLKQLSKLADAVGKKLIIEMA